MLQLVLQFVIINNMLVTPIHYGLLVTILFIIVLTFCDNIILYIIYWSIIDCLIPKCIFNKFANIEWILKGLLILSGQYLIILSKKQFPSSGILWADKYKMYFIFHCTITYFTYPFISISVKKPTSFYL